MAPSTDLNETLAVLAKILLRCFLLGFLFLIFWFLLYLAAADLMLTVHGGLFNLDDRDVNLLNYYGMAYFKMAIFVFFLIPYIAVRLVLRGIERTNATT